MHTGILHSFSVKSLYITVLTFSYMNIFINTRSESSKSDVNDTLYI